jgi:hypothetical protein
VSAEVLGMVGFFDTRFTGYGHEHSEWTARIKRAGYGYKTAIAPDGSSPKAQLYLSGGLTHDDVSSFRDAEQVRRNREVIDRLNGQPLFRRPWRTDSERHEFLAEQAAAGIEGNQLATRLEAAWRRGWS